VRKKKNSSKKGTAWRGPRKSPKECWAGSTKEKGKALLVERGLRLHNKKGTTYCSKERSLGNIIHIDRLGSLIKKSSKVGKKDKND